MTELLTESFCERCGTRYTFETPAPKAGRAGRVKQARTLARGLRNFVLDDDLPLEAALADARRDDDRARATQQLEAFHRTFNFCMDCRQYTCLDCWNEAEGRCLNCAPDPGRILATAGPIILGPPEPNGHLEGPALAGSEVEPGLPPDEILKLEPAPSLHDAVEALAEAAVTGPEADVKALAAATPLVLEADREPPPELLLEVPLEVPLGLAPEPPREPPPDVPLELAPEVPLGGPVSEAGPVPQAAIPGTSPTLATPPATWPPALPVAGDLPRAPRPLPPPPQPAPTAAPPWPPLAGPPSEGPAWPTGPSPLLPVTRIAAPAASGDAAGGAFGPWDASAAQVTARSTGAGIRSCVSCGLALSASARFCRRCGSHQTV